MNATALLPLLAALATAPALTTAAGAEDHEAIPLPEHPRPDFERADWLNLNGPWRFRFDPEDAGVAAGWAASDAPFERTIRVPFPWGAPLSGVEDGGDIGWYQREIAVPAGWEGRRVFLTVGASDWLTTAWLDGERLGEHQGGYTPFSFELTSHLRPGQPQRLVLRVDDAPREFRLAGKQGYGDARGVWQTVWLEARGDAWLESLHFTPDVANSKVGVRATLAEPAPAGLSLGLEFRTGGVPGVRKDFPAGETELQFDVEIAEPHLWSLDDPFLYEVEASLGSAGAVPDVVDAYFGLREISVVDLPGTDIPWIALNGEPVYLQLALDQAYHPEGYYTFPTDRFVRDEVLRARQIGLNGLRVHVKVAQPRKLYWADRLGVLIMSDVPNSWGEPTEPMRREVEYALEHMIARDYNHPSIFAWVPFNETWGLYTRTGGEGEERRRAYLPETKQWVVSVVEKARSLDPTRLVEDNSVCCGIGHTETDINSWHAYLPGWAWDEHLSEMSEKTHPGSEWNFEKGWVQGRQPNINSEFGNVWGYEGSTGDVDWSWDYHRAVNAFRRHPKIAGWLYTEHHDVVNEWNGYWRFDRSEKETGMGALVPGMSLRDLHGPLYLALGGPGELSRSARPGETVQVPVYASFLTGDASLGDTLVMRARLTGWDALGRERSWWEGEREVAFRPWRTEALPRLQVTMPDEAAVAVLSAELLDGAGVVRHRNFTTFVVESEAAPEELELDEGVRARVVRFEPASIAEAEWSLGHKDVLEGAKLDGFGSGHFTWKVAWPAGLDPRGVAAAQLFVEASSRPLLGRDREEGGIEGDFMRGRGTHDPALNPNAYPMTDGDRNPSEVRLRVNGVLAGVRELPDDPADHRGILSWHAQLRDRKLREAGTWGERLAFPLPAAALERAAEAGELELRLEVSEALPGGLAVYGRRFGRYPMDPTLVFETR